MQSDSTSGFPTPTTLSIIGPLATGDEGSVLWIIRVAGPITDTWYRFNVTAITGTFTVAEAIDIGN